MSGALPSFSLYATRKWAAILHFTPAPEGRLLHRAIHKTLELAHCRGPSNNFASVSILGLNSPWLLQVPTSHFRQVQTGFPLTLYDNSNSTFSKLLPGNTLISGI